MPPPCHHDPPRPPSCRLCHLYTVDERYRALWDGHPAVPGNPRSLPCIHLGAVLDQTGCPCSARWLRACAVHQLCTLLQCKTCPDYEPLG